MINPAATTQPAAPHPLLYMLLILPFGATTGFVTITLGFLLTNRGGVSVAAVATMIAITTAPNAFKFLWAPIVDFTLTAKKWYVIASVLTAISLFLTGALPPTLESLALITAFGLVANFANTLISMAVESLMAHNTPTEDMGRTAGWYQAGNLGGNGVGAGLALWIAERSTITWLPGATLAIIFLLCNLALLYLPSPGLESRANSAHSLLGQMLLILKEMFIDIWGIISRNAGFLALLICFLPIGSGGATSVFQSISREWGITDGVLVGNINGTAGGMLSALGSLVGGYICQTMDNKRAYALFGIVMVICALGMAWAPRTPNMYILFVLVYLFIVGLAYAAFTAVVLEVIGKGAAATKYNVFASLSNVPINYMGYLLGQAYDGCSNKGSLFAHCGSVPMLYTDAGMGLLGIVVFLAFVPLARRYLK
jgi:MFS family permease